MGENVSSRSDTSAGRLTNAQLLARGGHGAPPAKPRWASPSPGQSATPTQTATDRHSQDHKSSPLRPQSVTTKTTNCHHQHHRLSLQILQPPNQYFQDQNLKCMKFKSITETIKLPNAIKNTEHQYIIDALA